MSILIAECCQNHNGQRDILKDMIHQAAENGADYVKLQAIRSRELTHRERFDEGIVDENGEVITIKRSYDVELKRLQQLDLSLEDEQWFVDECRKVGVGSMTTTFTRTAAREVKDMGYEAVKVASYDCRSYPLLQDLKQWWSTIFVSTGATYDQEVARAAEILAGTNYSFLHCITIYPTPMSQQNLARINWLRQFTHQVGFSDHTRVKTDGLWASKIAIALGASVIERHYTILEDDQTKDGPISITPAMLGELRRFADLPRTIQMAEIRAEYPGWEQTIGVATRAMTPDEIRNRDYYSGRFASKVGNQVIYNWEDIDFDHWS